MPKLTTGDRAAKGLRKFGWAALACALLLGTPAAQAQQDQIRRVRDELALVQQEQQAVFQQFQMVKELKHGLENPPPPPPALTMRGGGFGLFGNLIVGVIGALVGGFTFGLLGLKAGGFVGSLVTATVGAVILLWLIGILKSK